MGALGEILCSCQTWGSYGHPTRSGGAISYRRRPFGSHGSLIVLPIIPPTDADQSKVESSLSWPLSVEALVDADLTLRDKGSHGQEGEERWGLSVAPPREEMRQRLAVLPCVERRLGTFGNSL